MKRSTKWGVAGLGVIGVAAVTASTGVGPPGFFSPSERRSIVARQAKEWYAWSESADLDARMRAARESNAGASAISVPALAAKVRLTRDPVDAVRLADLVGRLGFHGKTYGWLGLDAILLVGPRPSAELRRAALLTGLRSLEKEAFPKGTAPKPNRFADHVLDSFPRDGMLIWRIADHAPDVALAKPVASPGLRRMARDVDDESLRPDGLSLTEWRAGGVLLKSAVYARSLEPSDREIAWKAWLASEKWPWPKDFPDRGSARYAIALGDAAKGAGCKTVGQAAYGTPRNAAFGRAFERLVKQGRAEGWLPPASK